MINLKTENFLLVNAVAQRSPVKGFRLGRFGLKTVLCSSLCSSL